MNYSTLVIVLLCSATVVSSMRLMNTMTRTVTAFRRRTHQVQAAPVQAVQPQPEDEADDLDSRKLGFFDESVIEVMVALLEQDDTAEDLRQIVGEDAIEVDGGVYGLLMAAVELDRPESLAFLLSRAKYLDNRRNGDFSALLLRALQLHHPTICRVLLSQRGFEPRTDVIMPHKRQFWTMDPFHWDSDELIMTLGDSMVLDMLIGSADDLKACPTVEGARAMIQLTRFWWSTKGVKASADAFHAFTPMAYLEALAHHSHIRKEAQGPIINLLMHWGSDFRYQHR